MLIIIFSIFFLNIFLKSKAQRYNLEGCYIYTNQTASNNNQNNQMGPQRGYTQCQPTSEAFGLNYKKSYCGSFTELTIGGVAPLSSCNISCPDNSNTTCGGGSVLFLTVYSIPSNATTSGTTIRITQSSTTSTAVATSSSSIISTAATSSLTSNEATSVKFTTSEGTTSKITLINLSTKTSKFTSALSSDPGTKSITHSASSINYTPTTPPTQLSPKTSKFTSKSSSNAATSEKSTIHAALCGNSTPTSATQLSTKTSKITSELSTSKTAKSTSLLATKSTISNTAIEKTTWKPLSKVSATFETLTFTSHLPKLITSDLISSTAIKFSTNTEKPSMKLVKVEEVYGSIVRICVYSEWFNYSPCSATCGSNSARKRSRISITGGLCVKTYEMAKCLLPKCNPLDDTLALVAAVIQALGCTYLLGIVGGTFAICMLCSINTFERSLQASEELALFLAHIVIWSLGNKFDNEVMVKILCEISVALLQYFFIVIFLFLLLESFQAYCVLTNVNTHPVDILSKFSAMIILSEGLPFLYTVSTIGFSRSRLTSTFSCWINMDSNWNLSITGPCLVISLLAFIIAEAAGMEKRERITYAGKAKRITNEVSQKGLVMKIPLHLACWIAGVLTVHFRYFPMYMVVFGLNISLGIVIILFHTLGTEKVRNLIHKSVKHAKTIIKKQRK